MIKGLRFHIRKQASILRPRKSCVYLTSESLNFTSAMFGLIGMVMAASHRMEDAAAQTYREQSIWWIQNKPETVNQLCSELTLVAAAVPKAEIPDWETRIKFIPDTFCIKHTYTCWFRQLRKNSLLMVVECNMIVPADIGKRNQLFSYIFFATLNRENDCYEIRTRPNQTHLSAQIAMQYGTRFFEALKELKLQKNVESTQPRSWLARLFGT